MTISAGCVTFKLNLLLFPPSGEGRPLPLVSLACVIPLDPVLALWYYGIEVVLMPAVSQKQQQAMAIAEHEPDKLFKKNIGLLKMSHKQLHDFASTPRKGLPKKSPSKKVSK